MFLWEQKFSSAKNWGEGSTFPVVPSRLLHLNFSNTPLAPFSVNIRSSPKSFERVGFFALTKPVATLKSCCLLIHLQDSVLYLFQQTAVWLIGSSNFFNNCILTTFLIFFLEFTVVQTKEFFGYFVVNFLIADAMLKYLPCMSTSFLQK